MEHLDSDRLFVALTRPQMLLGVPYTFAILNFIITTELFLIFKSPWALFGAILIHIMGWFATLYDPHMFDLWFTKVRLCPRVPNYRFWRCNSYRP